MFKRCCICNGRTLALRQKIDGRYYCYDCFEKNIANMTPYPIPDSWLKIDHIQKKRLADSELALWFDGTLAKIHILLSSCSKKSYITRFTVIGIDRGSGRLVHVTYDDDWEYPDPVCIRFLEPDRCFQKLDSFPEEIRTAFRNFSQKPVTDYLNVSFPIDAVDNASMFVQETDGFVKVAFISAISIFYAKTSKQDFENWRKNKTIQECMLTRDELLNVAYGSFSSMFSNLGSSVEFKYATCRNKSPLTPKESANLFTVSFKERTLEPKLVSPELLNEFFEVFEKYLKGRQNQKGSM